ncbi:type II toxin-antitoxin system Phd/YefM family antitoxin [Anatilimnocola floriformis]|uniref:type II toxin-antitoxin system Phd/YefM family antitoxin n=1 Tax=Anatilimnocola floriformis TaxID=2948575 RepID=UPI0020C21C39|nr:type II toxin-antitoxin system prevent-host-death family antitoxin [Anatilimnocola floriformis]
MSTATVEEVQSRLPELLEKLATGESVIITRDGKPIARLTPEASAQPRILGSGKGKVLFYDHEDKSHLEDFKEYME